MSFLGEGGKTRQVVPRWYTFNTARLVGDVQPLAGIRERAQGNVSFEKHKNDWVHNRELVYAVDLVGTAIALNSTADVVVLDAAGFIRSQGGKASKLALEMANQVLEAESSKGGVLNHSEFLNSKDQFFRWIGQLKKEVRDYSLNPIKWVELAFFYSIVGQNEAARKCVETALGLTHENRYVVRSASRFFLHAHDPEAALFHLHRSQLASHDPWLMASEIAIADAFDLESRFLRKGTKLLSGLDAPSVHISELASAIATIELKAGETRKARKLFRTSLVEPTENAVAQIVALAKHLGRVDELIPQQLPPHVYEAEARFSFQIAKYAEALSSTQQWMRFQPFASKPSIYGSYIASVALGRFDEAIKIAEFGRISHPNDFMLTNNIAFSLASLGRASEAQQVLEAVNPGALDKGARAIYNATSGLIEFRLGNIELGRALYNSAIDYFTEEQDEGSLSIATYFLAREEKNANTGKHAELYAKAIDLAKKNKVHEIVSLPNLGTFSVSKDEHR